MNLQPWSVRAINLAEHADNVIHTDVGAQAAGFPRALVAGVTIYAYLTHVPAVGWGTPWIESGTAEVRFRKPIFEDELVVCTPVIDSSGNNDAIIEATVDGEVRATLAVSQTSAPMLSDRGDPFPDFELAFDDESADYGNRAGDTVAEYRSSGIAHPAVWPLLGNRATMRFLVDGPWIHVRSKVQHLGLASRGSEATVSTSLTRIFASRAGERAILQLDVAADGKPLARIEHESIIRLAD